MKYLFFLLLLSLAGHPLTAQVHTGMFDPHLAAYLDTIFQDDQHYRQKMKEVKENTPEWNATFALLRLYDSINVVKVSRILDEKGWLGPEVIGEDGNMTLFLVIQHAGINIQEKYLPMMRAAVLSGTAKPNQLAMLEDRVALRQGKRQVYGSQIGRDIETGELFISPLEDPDHVDERRTAVGLQPFQEYLNHWGITWDPEAYKRQLPDLEKKLKK